MNADEYNRSIERQGEMIDDGMYVPTTLSMENDVNKKNSGHKRAKSKKSTKGGGLLKAYFPSLISNKDPLKAKGSEIAPQKKRLFAGSKSSHADSSTRDVNLLPGGPPGSDFSRKLSAMENIIYDTQ